MSDKKKCVPCEGGMKAITEEEIKSRMSEIILWEYNAPENKISRNVTAKNFLNAVEVMQKIALLAEEENHHPDFHLTSYKKLRIDLSTHAVGGVTDNDFILAQRINEVLI